MKPIDLDEDERTPRTALTVIFFSFLCGLCLTLFASINSPIKFVFSLLALYVGIRAFGKLDKFGARTWFVVLAIIWFLLLTIIVTMVMYMKEHPLPEAG